MPSHRLRYAAPVLAAWCLHTTAAAEETVDIGVLKNSDISVVQNVLFPKKDRLEVGVHLGWMPFDPLITTPNLKLSIDKHFSDTLAFSALIGGGYGLTTGKYAELASPAYGVAPYAFRYLGSATFGISWAPVYAKMNFGGSNVVHFDIMGNARVGATAESSVIPTGGFTVAPTLALGIGARFWLKENLALRFAIEDDLLVEYRKLTRTWHFKQNAGITLGVSFFSKTKQTRARR